ncbi:MAG: 50S ribosomal protein L28 [Pseudomonadota bacterium]
MSRRCDLTDQGVMSGNNVSHAVNKTRRRFLPNLQMVTLMSDRLRQTVRLRISAKTIRTIDAKGGLDAFLLNTADRNLSQTGRKMKRRISRQAPTG